MANKPTTLLRLPKVLSRTGLGRSTLYRLVATGDFPAPIKLTKRSIAWPDSSVEEWIQEKTAEGKELEAVG